MMVQISNTLSLRAIKKYGHAAQVLRCVELLTELSMELCETIYVVPRCSERSDYNRLESNLESALEMCQDLTDACNNTCNIIYNGPHTRDLLIDTLADVLIMANQISTMISVNGELQNVIENKEKLLRDQIEGASDCGC